MHAAGIRDTLDQLEIPKDMPSLAPSITVLAFTNRTGSNLLGEYLRQTRCFYGFRELLNHTSVRKQSQDRGITSWYGYMEFLSKFQAVQGADFGIKASGNQIRLLHKWGTFDVFESCRFIRMTRHDRVAQAVSLWYAANTGQWASYQPEQKRELSYDFHALLETLEGVLQSEAALDLIMSLPTGEVYSLAYEDLIRRPQTTLERLLTDMGFTAPSGSIVQKKFERQEDDRKLEFTERFRRDLKQRWEIPVEENAPTHAETT